MVICIGEGLTLLGPWLPWPGLWVVSVIFPVPGMWACCWFCLHVPGCGVYACLIVLVVPVCGCFGFVYKLFLCSG